MSANELDLTLLPADRIAAASTAVGAKIFIELGGKPYRATAAQIKALLGSANAAFAIVDSGEATLVSGQVVVSGRTLVLGTDRIFVFHKTPGGTLGHLSVASQGAGGFTINASVNTDTSVVSWMAVRAAA